MILRIDYQESDVMLDLWGGTSGTFDGIDLFGRITDQRWKYYGGSPATRDEFNYGYDRNSNRQWKENTVSKALGTPVYMDEYYAYDNLNRLTNMKRGQLTGGPPPTGISGTPTREQAFDLDITGNWNGFLTKAAGTTDLDQARDHNTVNEISSISQAGGSPVWIDPAYDAAGNTTTLPQGGDPTLSYTAVYDAWNRLVSISDTGGTVATYQYDGRGRRIVKVTTSPSETRHFYYTNNWQDIEERTGSSTSADLQYVWGVRYVDELICRDASSTRHYALQDANFNVTSLTNTSGTVQERYVYFPYGQRLIFDASWATRSTSSYSWLIGHQGLLLDPESNLYYNRMRVLHPLLGRFLQRDPLGYVDGMSLYQYIGCNPVVTVDPSGQAGVAEATIKALILLSYACISHWALAMQNRKDWTNDKYAHCVVTCQISKACGKGVASLAGYGKEALDELRLKLADDGIGWDPADLAADEVGLDCSPSVIWTLVGGCITRWIVGAIEATCDACCQAKGIPPIK